MLRHKSLLAIFLLCMSTVAYSYDQAPTFTLNNLSDIPVSLSKYKGKVIYVDFWATWCGPCRSSFPWMEKMYQKYHDLGLEIIAINVDGKKKVIEQFLRKNTVNFTILRDPKLKTASEYHVKVMPSSFLIGRDGNFYFRHRGFNNRDKEKIEEKFRDLLLN